MNLKILPRELEKIIIEYLNQLIYNEYIEDHKKKMRKVLLDLNQYLRLTFELNINGTIYTKIFLINLGKNRYALKPNPKIIYTNNNNPIDTRAIEYFSGNVSLLIGQHILSLELNYNMRNAIANRRYTVDLP